MGTIFPLFSDVIATSTAGISSLGTYLSLPLIAVAFTVTAVVVAVVYFRKWLLKGLRGVTRMGGGRGRGRRR